MRTSLHRLWGWSSAGASRATSRELLARIGRMLLWLSVVVVLVRGLAGIANAQRPGPDRRGSDGAQAAAWPDDAARAFAVEFVTAYLTHAPSEDAGVYARRVEAFASAELAGQLAPTLDRGTPAQTVQAATVAGAERLDAAHALITVAVTLGSRPGRVTRWLSVPIARDRRGGLVVVDLPSFVGAPPRAAGGPVQGDPLLGSDSGAITDLVTRFLRAYLAGDTGALWYLCAPGARITSSAGGLRVLEVVSIELAAPASARARRLLVAARARDLAFGVTYGLRYRIEVVRRGRWYVAAIDGSGWEGER
jgi:hypothetical protein